MNSTEVVETEEDRRALRAMVELEGWRVVFVNEPSEYPTALGSRQKDAASFAQACEGNVLAIKAGMCRYAWYSAAHEIAEARNGFTGHHEHVWREQCTISARWNRMLAAETFASREPLRDERQLERELAAVTESLDVCRRERGAALDRLYQRQGAD